VRQRDGGEAQLGVELAGGGHELFRGTAATGLLDGFKRLPDAKYVSKYLKNIASVGGVEMLV